MSQTKHKFSKSWSEEEYYIGILGELHSSAVTCALSSGFLFPCVKQLSLEPSFSHKNTDQTSCLLGRQAQEWVVDWSCLLINLVHRARTKEKVVENLNTTFINSSLKYKFMLYRKVSFYLALKAQFSMMPLPQFPVLSERWGFPLHLSPFSLDCSFLKGKNWFCLSSYPWKISSPWLVRNTQNFFLNETKPFTVTKDDHTSRGPWRTRQWTFAWFVDCEMSDVSDDAKDTCLLLWKVETLSCPWRPRAHKDSTWTQLHQSRTCAITESLSLSKVILFLMKPKTK